MKRASRRVVGWFLAGFLFAHFALVAAVERFAPAVRDPEWAEIVARLHEQRRQAPGRELVVILGSSRSLSALDAGWLSRRPEGPLVFNASVPGAGPLMQTILLERLLAEGIRPDRLVLEVMPLFYGDRGARMEEGFLRPARLSAGEMLAIRAAAVRPGNLTRVWSQARLQPLTAHGHAIQRLLLPVSCQAASDEQAPCSGRDGFGFHPLPGVDEAERARRVQLIVSQYRHYLQPEAVCTPRLAMLDRLLRRCKEVGCAVTLFTGPEHANFRATGSERVTADIPTHLHDIAGRHGVGLTDAREWLADDLFADGHHTLPAGARQVSQRFECETLAQADSNSSRWTRTHFASASR